MSELKSYWCSVCGKKLEVSVFIKNYDYSTGKPQYYARYKCPDYKWRLFGATHDRRERYAFEVTS